MIGVAGRLSARVERRRGLENGDGLLQLGVLPLQLPDLPRRGGRRPVDLAGLDLGLTQPLRTVSGFIPSRPAIALIASYSEP